MVDTYVPNTDLLNDAGDGAAFQMYDNPRGLDIDGASVNAAGQKVVLPVPDVLQSSPGAEYGYEFRAGSLPELQQPTAYSAAYSNQPPREVDVTPVSKQVESYDALREIRESAQPDIEVPPSPNQMVTAGRQAESANSVVPAGGQVFGRVFKPGDSVEFTRNSAGHEIIDGISTAGLVRTNLPDGKHWVSAVTPVDPDGTKGALSFRVASEGHGVEVDVKGGVADLSNSPLGAELMRASASAPTKLPPFKFFLSGNTISKLDPDHPFDSLGKTKSANGDTNYLIPKAYFDKGGGAGWKMVTYSPEEKSFAIADSEAGAPGAVYVSDAGAFSAPRSSMAPKAPEKAWYENPMALLAVSSALSVIGVVGQYFMGKDNINAQLKMNRENRDLQLQLAGMQYGASGGGGGGGSGSGITTGRVYT